MPDLVFKIVTASEWAARAVDGRFTGSPDDVRDGFIHLSSAAQVRETAAHHFSGRSDLLLVALAPDALGAALRWEPSRGGDLFPHAYGDLPSAAVVWVQPLPRGADGLHAVPPLDRAPRASLAASCVAARAATARAIVLLHGIYGRGRNWQAIARAITAARPDYACWLVDLPYHGGSGAGVHGDTVRGVAADLHAWLEEREMAPDVILGHSFGGKVALAYADDAREAPLQIWVIDSTPDTKTPDGSAWRMLQVVRALPARLTSRTEAINAIVAAGFPVGVAQWMATNLVRDGDAFTWRLDFVTVERLLHSFFTTDLWAVVEHPAPAHDIHFLKASESSAMSPQAARRVEDAAGDHVHLHRRQGGHWIHAESPAVVADLVTSHLP